MTTTCPMFDTPNCRFLSEESMLIPFNKLVENPKTNRLEPAKETMMRKEPLGTFCNNASMWVDRLKYCPARWGLHRHHTGKKADGTGTYPDSQTIVAPSILFR